MNLSDMKRIANARTKGKWFIDECRVPIGKSICVHGVDEDTDNLIAVSEYEDADAEFIAMAANNWDKLIAVIEAAKDLLSRRVDDELAMGFINIYKAIQKLEKNV